MVASEEDLINLLMVTITTIKGGMTNLQMLKMIVLKGNMTNHLDHNNSFQGRHDKSINDTTMSFKGNFCVHHVFGNII